MNWKGLIQVVSNYKLSYKNYFMVLFKMYTGQRASRSYDVSIKVLLKNGSKLVVPFGWAVSYATMIGMQREVGNKDISEIDLSENGLSFKFKGNLVLIDPARFSDPYAVFITEDYSYLDVNDRDVIDIGMNIGDSLIYFSLKGAKKI